MSEPPHPPSTEAAPRPTGPPGPGARLTVVRGRHGQPVTMLGASPVLPVAWELFILAITVVSVVNIACYLLPIFSTGVRSIVYVVDVLLTLPLLADFLLRYRIAPSRRAYMIEGRGWLDLAGSLPLPVLRILRLVRVRRITQHLGQRGFRGSIKVLLREPAGGALLGVILLTFLVMEIGSAVMLVIEAPAAGALIKTPSDALWFSYETITTVGYGDVYPVTNAGRVVGVVVLTLGIALFATFTGFLANAFLVRTRSPLNVEDGTPEGASAAVQDDPARTDEPDERWTGEPDPGAAPATRADVAAMRDELEELRRLVGRLADREGPS